MSSKVGKIRTKHPDIGARSLQIAQKYFPKVKYVVDAEEPLRVEVTKQDASSKGRKSHSECAMAVACRRIGHLDGVIIATSRAYLVKGDTATRYEVPASVAREVVSFDRGSAFEPGSYSLYPPRPLAQHLNDSASKSTGPHKSKRGMHVTTNVRTWLGSDNER